MRMKVIVLMAAFLLLSLSTILLPFLTLSNIRTAHAVFAQTLNFLSPSPVVFLSTTTSIKSETTSILEPSPAMTLQKTKEHTTSSLQLKESLNLVSFLVNNCWQIFLSFLGGLITVAFIETGKYLFSVFRRYKYKTIFGKDISKPNAFHVVYAELVLPTLYNSNGQIIQYPYSKPQNPNFNFSISKPVSSCEVRAIKYLASSIGANTGNSPLLSSDNEIVGRLDINFVSIGAYSNFKSEDALNNKGNKLVSINSQSQFISVSDGRILKINFEEGFDYGLILKIHPIQFNKRVWIACAGIGEWGSSGAAWYLAHKWNDIFRKVKGKPFACIVKVKTNQDESSEPIIFVTAEKDLERII